MYATGGKRVLWIDTEGERPWRQCTVHVPHQGRLGMGEGVYMMMNYSKVMGFALSNLPGASTSFPMPFPVLTIQVVCKGLWLVDHGKGIYGLLRSPQCPAEQYDLYSEYQYRGGGERECVWKSGASYLTRTYPMFSILGLLVLLMNAGFRKKLENLQWRISSSSPPQRKALRMPYSVTMSI